MTQEVNVEKLSRQITLAAKAYYEGKASITDEAFDSLVERLRQAEPEHPILTTPGWGYRPEGKRTAQHSIYVGSLPKMHDLRDVRIESILTPKFDGISIVAYYQKGRLKQVLTRGDGQTGVVVTGRVALPNNVDWDIAYVKGEAVIAESVFNSELQTEYANPRNAVAGIVNAHDSQHTDKVLFIACEFGTRSGAVVKMNPTGVQEVASNLSMNGFIVPNWLRVTDVESLQIEELQVWANQQNVQVDGLVLNGEHAIKFRTEAVETTVIGVDWRLSEKGRLIPVLQIEPVELYGTTVTNVTGYHAQYIKDEKLGVGAVVKVTKANEIIPYITEIVSRTEAFELPSAVDGAPCTWDGVHLIVENKQMRERKSLFKFISTLVDCDGLGDTVLGALIDAAEIRNIDELVSVLAGILKNGDAAEVFPREKLSAHQAKLSAEILKQLTEPLDREKFLFALNLDGLGESTSRALGPHLDKIVQDGNAENFQDLIKQNKKKVLSAIEANIELIRKCTESLLFTEIVESKPVAMTGKMSLSRKALAVKLKEMGYHETGSVNADTIVVAANPEGSSSKLKKARKVGARIMSESEFFGQPQ